MVLKVIYSKRKPLVFIRSIAKESQNSGIDVVIHFNISDINVRNGQSGYRGGTVWALHTLYYDYDITENYLYSLKQMTSDI